MNNLPATYVEEAEFRQAAAWLSENGIVLESAPRYSLGNVLLNRWDSVIQKLRSFAHSHDGKWAIFGAAIIVIAVLILL